MNRREMLQAVAPLAISGHLFVLGDDYMFFMNPNRMDVERFKAEVKLPSNWKVYSVACPTDEDFDQTIRIYEEMK